MARAEITNKSQSRADGGREGAPQGYASPAWGSPESAGEGGVDLELAVG